MSCQINNNSNFDVTEIEDLIQDLHDFSQKRLGFRKPPVLNLMSDESNTSPLGKTAHYDPNNMEITIYVDGRHPKDIMRSFSHELVHHCQNENGMFNDLQGESGDGYAQTNPHLRKMEKQAYLQGNMCFRDWEDGYKSSNPNILNERRIYKMSIKDWKDKELNGLLNERWGFSMNLNKLNEASCGSHKRDDKQKVEEKQFANDDNLDGDKDGKPKWADPDDPANKGKSKEKKDDKPKKKAKKGEIPPQLRQHVKGEKEVNENEEDKKMGDNPEGIAELMDAINGLSEKESEEVYKMLLKKHGKKEDKKHSDMDMKERKLREAVRKIIRSKLNRK